MKIHRALPRINWPLICTALIVVGGRPAYALSSNPLGDGGEYPLSIHALTFCDTESTGTNNAACGGFQLVPSTTTLSVAQASSHAYAALAAGTLKADATAFVIEDLFAKERASAALYDTLTFSGLPSGGTLVTLAMSIDGSFVNYVNGSDGEGSQGTQVLSTLQLFDNTEQSQAQVNLRQSPVAHASVDVNSFLTHATHGHTGAAAYAVDFTEYSTSRIDVHITLTTSLLVTPGDPEVTFVASLFADAGSPNINEVDCCYAELLLDFAHTAQLSVDVPAGVTYSSQSGVFLTDVAPVPLPAAGWLLGSALGGVGFMGRRRVGWLPDIANA